MKDNLESYFKKHLNEDAPSEDWNSPGDDVWDNATVFFDEEPKNRKFLWLWFAIGLLVLSLAFSIFYINKLNNQVAALAQNEINISTQQNQSETSSTTISNTNKETINPESNSNLNSEIAKENTPTKETTLNNKTADKASTLKTKYVEELSNLHSKTAPAFTTKTIVSSASKATSIQNTTLSNSNVLPSHKKANLVAIIKESIENIEDNKVDTLDGTEGTDKPNKTINDLKSSTKNVAPIQIKAPFLVMYTDDQLPTNTLNPKTAQPLDKVKDDAKINKHILSAYVGPSLTATPMSSETNTSNLIGYNELQLASNFGVDYKYKLSPNIYIKSGLGYLGVKSWSYSENDYTYTSDGEYQTAGEVHNNMTIPMPTPTGEIQTQIVIRQSAANEMLDGDQFRALMDLHQEYQYVKIPLGVGYILPLNDKHSINFGLGANYLRLLSNKDIFTADLIKESSQTEMIQVSTDMGPHLDINKNIFTANAELGYQYQLRNNLSLDATFEYFRSLNSLYSLGDVSTKAHGFNLRLGVSVGF